jgi:arsenite-transporting ATPase
MVNRILPENSSNAVFGEYLEAQQTYLEEITDTFAPLPIFRAPHLGREVFGAERLRAIGQELYQGQDPQQIFFRRKPYHFIERDYGYLLSIHLPHLTENDVAVSQNGDELIIQAKNRRRNLFLPKFLAYYRVTSSQVMDGQLLVRFEKS